jgi:chromosome partitioning protein
MPAVMALATLDRQAGRLEGMGLVLKEALTLLESHYDYAIIDCPPILGVLMINALAACERLVIPVQTEFLALKGLERMLNTLQMVFKSRRMDLPYTIVPTMYDVRTRASKQSLKLLRESHAEHIWQGLIPIDTRFRDASRAGVPPDTFDPNARGVVAYDRLLQYLQQGHRQRVSRLAV